MSEPCEEGGKERKEGRKSLGGPGKRDARREGGKSRDHARGEREEEGQEGRKEEGVENTASDIGLARGRDCSSEGQAKGREGSTGRRGGVCLRE